LNNNSTSSAGGRTPTPAPALQLDKGKGKEVTPSAEPSSSAPRKDRGNAKEVTPGEFNPNSKSLEEEILSPATADEAQRRRDTLAAMGGSYGSGNNNMSSLLGMGGMGGRTLGGASGPIRSGNEDPLSGLLSMGGMGGRTLGGASGPIRPGNDDPLSSPFGMGAMGGRTMGTPSPPPPTGTIGRPLGSSIQQMTRAPPPSGRAGGGRLSMSGMAGLESLLGGFGGLGPGGGLGTLGGLGGGRFDPEMFGPEFIDPGSYEDKAEGGNKGINGTGTGGGEDDTPRSGTWSGMGIQSNLSDDGA
jgi:hypothetical protein